MIAQFPPFKGFYGLVSYSLSKTEFKNMETGAYQPSFNDARHVANIVIGKHFKGWHLGLIWRFQSGQPFTPWDLEQSSSILQWNQSLGRGITDYNSVNSQRLANSCGVDIRIDKTFKFKKTQAKALSLIHI